MLGSPLEISPEEILTFNYSGKEKVFFNGVTPGILGTLQGRCHTRSSWLTQTGLGSVQNLGM